MAAAKPMFLNKISVVSYTVRILLLFVLKEGWRKNISISAPYVAPVVRPCLYGVERKIQIVLCTGINKAGYIDFIIVAAAILYITGIRAVAAVAWLVSLIVGLVLIDGIALFKCFVKRSCPLPCLTVKAQLVHEFFRVKVLDLYSQGRYDAIIAAIHKAE